MTHDPVLHALADLVQQCEKDKCSFSDMRPFTAAMDMLRSHVRVANPPEALATDEEILPLTLRDKMAAACLPAIYASMTQLTDRASVLAYEQADEMLKARESPTPQHGSETK